MNGLEIQGMSIHYGAVPAIEDVSLTVAPGEIVAVAGPSGSGKSTLLRGIAGLEELTAGRVLWDGEDLTDVPVNLRGFGLMFQDGQLFPHMSVAANVAYGLKMAGRPRAERAQEASRWLSAVGLAGYERRDVATLSGGQAQRVALARALAPGPRLLLLDEPLSALDTELREELGLAVRAVLNTTTTAALWVTHDPAEAAAADRVISLDSN